MIADVDTDRSGNALASVTNRELAGDDDIEHRPASRFESDTGALVRDPRMMRDIENFVARHRVLHLRRVAFGLAHSRHSQRRCRDDDLDVRLGWIFQIDLDRAILDGTDHFVRVTGDEAEHTPLADVTRCVAPGGIAPAPFAPPPPFGP